MASVKNLKKDINYTLGDIIEECYIAQMLAPANSEKTEAIIDEAIESFDALIEKLNAKNVEDKKAHYKAINADLEAKANALVEKLNKI
ncbi:MAG: ATP adenylyltransferase/5',5'''-P-1,P-4-tetraphosphate phosphorylase II [Polaribacter sp.]|jgi:ATP adenylyltransferase/5',5'''-P-1,P-4-tetraphosphate phosphorylase II